MERRMRICQHCREGFQLASTGRPPKFCSATCRKNAWEAERIRQAVALAKVQAVAAERRRVARAENRGNETPEPAENRGNETPPQARTVQPQLPLPEPKPQIVRPTGALPTGPSLRTRRRLLPPPPGAERATPETG